METMKNDPDYLSNHIRKAIEKSGYSAYRLSKETGIHHTVIIRFINGERDIQLSTASKLMDVLKLEIKPKKKGR